MKIPGNYQTVMPYLLLTDASGFTQFCEKVFNANSATPHMREDNKTMMHGEVMIGTSTIMFADVTEAHRVATANLFVYVENADETYALALANGAVSVMELSNQNYGRTGGIKDPYDNVWWITSVI
ncbi:MAG: VOC family protein [Ferruginibacter sp.]